ncbi:hypothetical protein BGZ58_003508, partial [Dissophora ornata]
MSANTNTNIPRIVLGTMTFGLENTTVEGTVVRVRGAENVGQFVDKFHSFGHIEIDTARIYGSGDSELVLSQLPTAHLKISTKVFPGFAGAFDAVNLPRQFRQSLEALKTNKIDILYLHAPESDTPIDVTLKAINDLYKEGLFERYNPIARSVVPELLPCLKHYNIGFYAFNIVGGGLLTGKYKFSQEAAEGSRYDTSIWSGKAFHERYWKNLNFEGIEIVETAAKTHGLTLLEAT